MYTVVYLVILIVHIIVTFWKKKMNYITFIKYRYTTTASTLVEEACLNTCHHIVCDNIDLDTILIEYENYYYLRYQKKPKISKSLDVTKTDNHSHVHKNKTKTTKKTSITSQCSRDLQTLDTSFITVTPVNNSNDETLEREYALPTVDLSYWKDEWQVYAEIISKVITKNTFARSKSTIYIYIQK